MRRREVMAGLGGAIASAAASPRPARAQRSGSVRRVGILMAGSDVDLERRRYVAGFRDELAKRGWAEGRNILIDIRWTTPDLASMQQCAKDLIAILPDLILSHDTSLALTVLSQTRSIPLIVANTSDPVGSGLVDNLSRPSGNVTGFMNIEPTMVGKWLELLKQIAPQTAHVALLFNPATAPYVEYYLGSLKAAATSLALEAITTPVLSISDIESAIALEARQPRGSFVVMTDSFLVTHRARIIAMAAEHRLPAVYPFRFFAREGGLMSYGNSTLDNFKRAGIYAHRILNGASPKELPVQAPVEFELTINTKTARTLGLDIPPSLLARADEVIE